MDPAIDLPAVEYAERSDPGRDPSKQVNEDACGHRETRLGHLCVVCDGMGGHAAGREAAELALSTIFATFDQAPEGAAPAGVLRAALEEASRRVHSMPAAEVALGRPGSTVVAVLMHAHGTEVAHIGDSRAYLIHEGQIFRVTRDHSVVQEMVDRGLLTLQQAAKHPDANRITRALGMAPEVEADVRPQALPHLSGDTFVLCSDGLSDLVEDAEILDAVGGVPAAQAVGKLVDLANARGGHDNITVLVLRARVTSIVSSGGVAPTIAQTQVTPVQPTRALPMEASAPNVERPTEVPLTEPLEPTRPPPATFARPRGARFAVEGAGAAVIVGLLIGIMAVALLASVLLAHVANRKGTHNAASAAGGDGAALLVVTPDAGGALVPPATAPTTVPTTAPTTLLPQSVDLPAAPAQSAPPIAPLETEPKPELLPHKKRKQ